MHFQCIIVIQEEQEVVTKQLRKNMVYKANPVPNFYYEAPPPKLPLKKVCKQNHFSLGLCFLSLYVQNIMWLFDHSFL